MNLAKYFSIGYYANAFGFMQTTNLNIVKNQPVTDEDIETIDMDFVRRVRESVRWINANSTDIAPIVNADVAGIIGSSVNIQSRLPETKINEDIEAVIADWSLECDVTDRFHFNSALRAMVEFTDKDGGILIRHHYNPEWEYGYKIELIEVGMVDMDKHDPEANILNGIKKDKYGKITGVYLYNDSDRIKSTLVDYEELIYFSPVWVSLSQYTAVTKFAQLLPTIDKMNEYTQAELDKVIEEAKAGNYWRTSMYDDIMKIVKATKDERKRQEQLSTIMSSISEKGIKPSGLTPIPLTDEVVTTPKSGASVYQNLDGVTKGNMASSQGLSAQIAYQDAGASNYSSIKAMMAFANIQWSIRWDNLEKKVVLPILKRLITSAVTTKKLKINGYLKNPKQFLKLEFVRVCEIDIEPAKTANADKVKLENGTISKREIARRRGRNYEDVLREILEDELLEKTLREEMGLTIEINEDGDQSGNQSGDQKDKEDDQSGDQKDKEDKKSGDQSGDQKDKKENK